MWGTIITVALQVVSWVLGKNAENEEFQKLFYQFVDRMHTEYLNSAKMRLKAQARLEIINKKEFQESP